MSPNLTTLPLEVRNEIYGHLFKHESITPFTNKTGKLLYLNTLPKHDDSFLLFKASHPQKFLALLLVNRQISDEAATFFYAKTKFHGKWFDVVAFVKGIGARRRDMIRSVEISHPAGLNFVFEKDEDLEMLSGLLPNLRTLRITAWAPDFTRLQNQLIQGGILKLAGKIDISVCNTDIDTLVTKTKRPVWQKYKDRHEWRCAKGTTQWTGGKRVRTIVAKFNKKRQCWVDTGKS